MDHCQTCGAPIVWVKEVVMMSQPPADNLKAAADIRRLHVNPVSGAISSFMVLVVFSPDLADALKSLAETEGKTPDELVRDLAQRLLANGIELAARIHLQERAILGSDTPGGNRSVSQETP